jgi:hypothetical protein
VLAFIHWDWDLGYRIRLCFCVATTEEKEVQWSSMLQASGKVPYLCHRLLRLGEGG